MSDFVFGMIWECVSGSNRFVLMFRECLDHWFGLNFSLTQNPMVFAIVTKMGGLREKGYKA